MAVRRQFRFRSTSFLRFRLRLGLRSASFRRLQAGVHRPDDLLVRRPYRRRRHRMDLGQEGAPLRVAGVAGVVFLRRIIRRIRTQFLALSLVQILRRRRLCR